MNARRALRLGHLERAVIERLWSSGPCDVKGMQRAIGQERGVALHTIQSTLERLHRKGLADRRKVGRAYVYAPTLSRRDWIRRCIEDLVGAARSQDARAVVSAFVDVVERAGEDDLAELERLVRERRRARARS
jgi:predicted transcriptional regulator